MGGSSGGVAVTPGGGASGGGASGGGSNPRKFSEKIALHKQKEAEEKMEFEKMMSELKAVKGRDNSSAGGPVTAASAAAATAATAPAPTATSSAASMGGAVNGTAAISVQRVSL